MYKVINVLGHKTVHTASTILEARKWIDGLSNCDLDAMADCDRVELVIFFGKHNARLQTMVSFNFNHEDEAWERV